MRSQLADLERQLKNCQENCSRLEAGHQIANTQAEKSQVNPKEQNLSEGLSARKLAERLGVSDTSVGRNREKDTFADWSKKRDPDSLSWCYEKKLDKYFPDIL